MSALHYLKERIAELVLLAVMTAALSATMAECFFIDLARPGNIAILLGMSAALPVLLYAAASSRRAVAVGTPACIVLVAVLYVVLAQLTPTQLFEDSYANSVFMCHVVLVVGLLLFLCTRRTALLVAAFVVGAFLCSAVQFLYAQNHVPAAALFLVAGAALIMLRRGVPATGELARGPRQALGAPVAVVGIATVSLGLACAVFFAFVAPLNPPALELKLVTEHYALEEVHVSGLTDIIHMVNRNASSKNLSDETGKTNRVDNSDGALGSSEPEHDEGDASLGGGAAALGDVAAQMVKYLQEHWLPVLLGVIALLAAAIALIIAWRRWQRRRRLARFRALGASGEAAGIYRYVSDGLGACGVCERGSSTPVEMARNARQATDEFEGEDMPLAFVALTELFARSAYGGIAPGEDEREKLRAYCRAFPAHVMRYAGKRRYLRLFFKV